MSFRGLKLVQLFPAVHRTAMSKKKCNNGASNIGKGKVPLTRSNTKNPNERIWLTECAGKTEPRFVHANENRDWIKIRGKTLTSFRFQRGASQYCPWALPHGVR